MKILYIGVHFFKNENKWRTETWIDLSFNNNNIQTIKIDYRNFLKDSTMNLLKKIIFEKSKDVDLIFIQRGENLNPELFSEINIPIVFWSTEPINLKNDVDLLLNSNIFSWVFLHTYSCLDRIKKEFPHLINKSSILHNAIPQELLKVNNSNNKKYFAIFNRSLSLRRRFWLYQNLKYIKIIKGNYGDLYYKNLSDSLISVNIHFSSKNLDDFETGIFEAMAQGCVVISEKLDSQTLKDLNMKKSIIEVSSPQELNQKLAYIKNNPDFLKKYITESNNVIYDNTWNQRTKQLKNKFKEVLLSK